MYCNIARALRQTVRMRKSGLTEVPEVPDGGER